MNAERDEMTTYKRADGDLIGDYGWVTDLEWFEDDDWSPVELVRERWVLAERETYWRLPENFYDCAVDWCDNDAVEWVQQDSTAFPWIQVCAEHKDADARLIAAPLDSVEPPKGE